MPLLDSVRTLVQSTTELKVKQATDENESSGATGTLMNEISVLTYSPKTLKEIVQVVRKRLMGHGRRNSHKICIHLVKIKDDDLLENRRAEVIQFRSSISSPGRKSTDNSHLKKWSSTGRASSERASHVLSMSPITPSSASEFQCTSNVTRYYDRGLTSLDLKRRFVRGPSTDHSTLDPLHEEEDIQAGSVPLKTSTNPFR